MTRRRADMSSNYIFIPYNFDDFDFEQLRKEQRDGKGKILWEYGERCPKINKKDVCYIYCSNLPDMINRILKIICEKMLY